MLKSGDIVKMNLCGSVDAIYELSSPKSETSDSVGLYNLKQTRGLHKIIVNYTLLKQ